MNINQKHALADFIVVAVFMIGAVTCLAAVAMLVAELLG